jgi:peptide-methionine (R)-S-oxide reductase
MASLNRRSVLLGGTAIVGAVAIGSFVSRSFGVDLGPPEGTPGPVPGTFEVTHTDAEWQKILGDDAFKVMRQQYTEAPGSSPLLNEHRVGTFACAGCDLPLYDSKTKFDSGTGWPSFWQSLPNAVTVATDMDGQRDECHCRRCGGHLGHLFHDVPSQPMNNRYCMDGLALKFVPGAA